MTGFAENLNYWLGANKHRVKWESNEKVVYTNFGYESIDLVENEECAYVKATNSNTLQPWKEKDCRQSCDAYLCQEP